MSPLTVWTVLAAFVCGVGYIADDARPAIVMFLVSLLLPDDTFVVQ